MSRQPGPRSGRCSPTPDQLGFHAGPERLGLHGGVGGGCIQAICVFFALLALSGCADEHNGMPTCTRARTVEYRVVSECGAGRLVVTPEKQSVIMCDAWAGMPTPGYLTFSSQGVVIQ